MPTLKIIIIILNVITMLSEDLDHMLQPTLDEKMR